MARRGEGALTAAERARLVRESIAATGVEPDEATLAAVAAQVDAAVVITQWRRRERVFTRRDDAGTLVFDWSTRSRRFHPAIGYGDRA
ncbi:hypothetical protein [Microbacterium sp.]|uniref:hypothetical protein n=1 Tax=Microbacterium sp. TaxID=51671 RepID=UPI003C77A58A